MKAKGFWEEKEMDRRYRPRDDVAADIGPGGLSLSHVKNGNGRKKHRGGNRDPSKNHHHSLERDTVGLDSLKPGRGWGDCPNYRRKKNKKDISEDQYRREPQVFPLGAY